MNYLIGLTKVVELVESIKTTRNNLFHYQLEYDDSEDENNINDVEEEEHTTNDSKTKIFFIRLLNHFSFIATFIYQSWNLIRNFFKFLSIFLELLNGILAIFYLIYKKIKLYYILKNNKKFKEQKDTVNLKGSKEILKQHEIVLNTEKKTRIKCKNFTIEQKNILNACFDSGYRYPGYLKKVELANATGLTIKQVEDWFKQKRFKT